MQVDPYNRYCVDCLHQRSTHAVLSYGIFVCEACALKHRQGLYCTPPPRVKNALGENWDDLQLARVDTGNRRFFEWLEEYRLHNVKEVPLEKRYKSDAVRYYVRRANAAADE
jgi:hypothetical protein